MKSIGPLLLARHGQTEWNLARRRQGQLDSPLTAAGRSNAQILAHALAGLGVDMIATSPLGRAHETARIFAAILGADVFVIPELAELHHEAMAGLTDDEISERHPDAWSSRAADKYRWRFPDGESYADAEARADRALSRIGGLEAALPLVVSHEMIGRVLRRHLLALDVEDALALSHPQDVAFLIEQGRERPIR